ncbi:histone acetyltransferase KAT8 [Halyomorpha halys]|uniref:histone acetyltransferase KAT8 n=1 Tax=Halyomorpha halys TaxID=286706 RepID=UPI0006D4FB10|nr:histone acetyltransferase KAT8 isoform X2 [Halyomorpha halys]
MVHKVNGIKRKVYSEDDSEEERDSIQIGHHYMVKRKDNVWVKAEVIQRRFNKQGKFTEYYVHYDSLNRRLDEWVPSDRIIHHNNESSDESESFEGGRSSESSEESSQLSPFKALPSEETGVARSADDVEKEHAELTKVKYINTIQFGVHEIDTWYFSPYPGEYGQQEKLFICEYCLKYMRLEKTYRYHMGDCIWRAPPGLEIYRKGTLSVHEVDPALNRLYCQNLCLLAKLFIDHKTIFFDVDQFLFYILCEVDKHGAHIRGYFSKEKESPDGHNVACILTLPPFQRQGYGKLLIGFSYELSKLEEIVGTPEKPLSDLGKLSYRSYWSWVLLDILKDFHGCVSISYLCKLTSMTENDIISTLEAMKMLKYWNGTKMICVTPALVESHILSPQFKRPRLTVDANAITWSPHRTLQNTPCEDRSCSKELDGGNIL